MKDEIDLYQCLKILEIYHDPKDQYLVRFIYMMKKLSNGQLLKITEKQKNYLILKASLISIRKCYSDISKIIYEKQN